MPTAAKALKIEEAVKKLLPFVTTYLCEQRLPTLMNIKTKQRNLLSPEDKLQIALTSKCLNFDVIASETKQPNSPNHDAKRFQINPSVSK